jgi:hypothetical protein
MVSSGLGGVRFPHASRPLPAVLRVTSPSSFAPKIIPASLRPGFVPLARRVSRPLVLLSSSVAFSSPEAFPGENLFRDYVVELHNAVLYLWWWDTVCRSRVKLRVSCSPIGIEIAYPSADRYSRGLPGL